MVVQLAGVRGGTAMVVEANPDSAEPGFDPQIRKAVGPLGKIELGPFAVAVVTGISG